jgi:DNA-binding winged helix-turn-helix (wHTH) protein
LKFSFPGHTLDTDRRELRRGSEPVAVEPQVFDLLIYLLMNRERVVSKDDLIAAVWGGRIVSDSTLTSRINAARKAIGDSGEQQKLIRTIARKGLRFVGAVDVRSDDGQAGAAGALVPPPDTDPNSQRLTLPRPERPAIAVLPFINMSGDPEQEYFVDGMVEDAVWMHLAQELSGRCHRQPLNHGLKQFGIKRVVDIRYARSRGETKLIRGVVAPEVADVVQRPRLQLCYVVSRNQLGIES